MRPDTRPTSISPTPYTVNDVLTAINNNGVADVTASTDGGHIVLTDSSGGSGSLTVTNLNGDTTATDLGINQSSSNGTITGQNVYQAAAGTTLSQINDGNGIYTVARPRPWQSRFPAARC